MDVPKFWICPFNGWVKVGSPSFGRTLDLMVWRVFSIANMLTCWTLAKLRAVLCSWTLTFGSRSMVKHGEATNLKKFFTQWYIIMIHLDHYNSKHCGFCMVFVGFVPGAQVFPMSSQFFPLVPAASLATLCTRALFSVWLQATLASKGRPWTWLTKTPTIVSIVTMVTMVTIVTCGPSLPFDNYTSNESWWTLVEWSQDASKLQQVASGCQASIPVQPSSAARHSAGR